MRKLITLLALTALIGTVSGCQKNSPKQAAAPQGEAKQGTDSTENKAGESDYKAVLLIPGTLGDKSFFDAANKGMQEVEKELGATIKVIEMGTDKTKYEPTFRDVCSQDWDVIVSGSPDMTDVFNEFAPEYPDKKFINFDASNDNVVENVYAMGYAANELSFLTGAAAALFTTSPEMKLANDKPVIGFIGGMDIPGINDFLVGYIEGAQYVNPEIKVAVSYAQDFANPGKGKELAINQYNTDVDVIFNVAGGTGLGSLDAASEKDKYAIGVDSDQALLFKGTDDKKANHIVTSAIKRIDIAVFNAIDKDKKGELEYGKYELLGLKSGGVGITKNEIFNELVPEDVKAEIERVENDIIEGKTLVSTAIGMSPEELSSRRDRAKP